MTTGTYPRPRIDRAAAQRDREAAFARIGRVRGLTIVGAGALSVAIAAAASSAAHGHTLGAKSSPHHVTGGARRTAQAGVTKLKMPPLATPGQLGLQAPGSAPQAVSPPASSSPSPSQSAPSTQNQAQPSTPAPSQPAAPAATVPAPASPAPSSGGTTSGGS